MIRKKHSRIRCQICDRSLLQENDITDRPLCGICFKNLIDFIANDYPGLAESFLILNLKNLANRDSSLNIKRGLDEARANGITLGRPVKAYPIEQINFLREQGYTYRKIAKELNIPLSGVHRVFKKRLHLRKSESTVPYNFKDIMI